MCLEFVYGGRTSVVSVSQNRCFCLRQLVLEYAKVEQECGELRNKMESCEEEASYYQNKSCDLASEFNALLDAFQRVSTFISKQCLYYCFYICDKWSDYCDHIEFSVFANFQLCIFHGCVPL